MFRSYFGSAYVLELSRTAHNTMPSSLTRSKSSCGNASAAIDSRWFQLQKHFGFETMQAAHFRKNLGGRTTRQQARIMTEMLYVALMLEKRAVLAKLALGCRSVGHPRVQKFAAVLAAKTKHCVEMPGKVQGRLAIGPQGPCQATARLRLSQASKSLEPDADRRR